MTDGLEEITLGKPYGDSQAGATLRVDSQRAAWLRENGYEASAEPEAEAEAEEVAPRRRSRRPVLEEVAPKPEPGEEI